MRGASLIVALRPRAFAWRQSRDDGSLDGGLSKDPDSTNHTYQLLGASMRATGWADLYAWQVDRTTGTPLFRQMYLQLRSAIVSRTLAPGTRLPSTRELAARLRVARTSVISAYEQLLAEGYIAGKARSGTFIASDLPMPSERRPLDGIPRTSGKAPRVSVRAKALAGLRAFVAESDATPFNMGRTRVDPRTVAAWRRVTHRAVRSLDAVHLGYSDPRGLPELRETLCDYLRVARAVRCDPDQIIVTGGTQPAIYVGTLNKALFPGLRIGYMVVPRPLMNAFVHARYLIDRQPSSFEQTIVTDFMRQGHFAAHIRRTRAHYREQRDALVGELRRRAGDAITVEAPEQGMHLIAYLRGRRSDVNVERAARARGIIVRAIRPMYRNARPRSGLMLGFSGYSVDALVPAAAALAKVITANA